MVFLPMQIKTYSISVELMCIFKFISKETCNTKKVTFMYTFTMLSFIVVGVKEKIKPIWVYCGHIRLVYISYSYSFLRTFSMLFWTPHSLSYNATLTGLQPYMRVYCCLKQKLSVVLHACVCCHYTCVCVCVCVKLTG